MGRAAFWMTLSLIIAAIAAPGVTAQEGGDLIVVGQHTIQAIKNGAETVASVTEIVHYRNTGTTDYTGDIFLDLDPQANVVQYYFTTQGGTALTPADQDPLPNQTVGGHTRYTIDLAAENITFPAGNTTGLTLVYTLPGDDLAFTRGFAIEHPSLRVVVGQAPGLAPSSDDVTFQPQGTSWVYTLDAESQGTSFAAGSAFNFTWETVTVPQAPLSVSLSSTGREPVTVRATVRGGIPPYAISWDTDGDDQCDDAEGESVALDASDAGTHTVMVCVTDAAAPAGDVREDFQVRTLEGSTIRTGPTAWLLALVGLLVGAILVYGLVQGGIVGGRRGGTTAAAGDRPSFAAESRDMLEVRQRVMIAGLKELEIAKKKGEVAENLYTPLKSELKQDTVRVMRELEKRKGETV